MRKPLSALWKCSRLVVLAAVLTGLAGCQGPSGPIGNKGSSPAELTSVYQYSTLGLLQEGQFEGGPTLGEIRTHGNLGIGTFHALDGEMILLDGKVYQGHSDGNVYTPPDSVRTPFVAVVEFSVQQSGALADANSQAVLSELLDKALPQNGGVVVVRIDGAFDHVKVRSVPAQTKPYPRLIEASRHQSVNDRSNIRGTVVAMRFPSSLQGMNLPGWHMHFISADRSFGGHMLEASGANLTYQAARYKSVCVELPPQNIAVPVKTDAVAKELEKIEK